MNRVLLQGVVGVGSLVLTWLAGWLTFVFFLVGAGACLLTASSTYPKTEKIWWIGLALGMTGALALSAMFFFVPGIKIFLGLFLGSMLSAVLFYFLSQDN